MGENQSQAGREEPRRLSVAKASEVLGVSVEAVRGRIKRGTLQSERTDKGVYVLLEADQPRPDTDQSTDQPQSDTTALTSEVESLREQVEWLRGEVQRKDAILLNMTEAMKALSPPPQEREREAPVPSEDATEGGGSRPAPEGPQEGVQRPQERSWWRRLIGG